MYRTLRSVGDETRRTRSSEPCVTFEFGSVVGSGGRWLWLGRYLMLVTVLTSGSLTVEVEAPR